MTDLNDWMLDTGTHELTFGTLASEFPFVGQVDQTETSATNQDAGHPNSDGMVMGIDRLGGFSLIFTLVTVPVHPVPSKPWDPALDTYGEFLAAWRADQLRRMPGVYATLTNLDRGREVYGRPRKPSQSNLRLRKGEIRYVAQFDTIDPNWYANEDKLAIITPVPPPGGGFTFPLTPPFSLAGSGDDLAPMVNDGNVDTWPVIEIRGPGTAIGLDMLDGGGNIRWSLKVAGGLTYDETMVVDTRPWRRGATINGQPAGGRLRGTALDRCVIPPGSFNARYRVKDKSGVSFADIRWRDAFVSM